MRIAYRRYSGPIGVTESETGTRGMWLEKRNALVEYLTTRGHEIDFVGRATKPTQELCGNRFNKYTQDKYEYLIVEFGSSNKQFYGDDIEETEKLIKYYSGRGLFICDDPELFMPSAGLDKSRWAYGVNATRVGGVAKRYGVQVVDLPFASILPHMEPRDTYEARYVYSGKPGGRKKMLKQLLFFGVPMDVYGRSKEWCGMGVAEVKEQPTQAERKQFYSTKAGCLCLADAEHKLLGWRTGRAYHAVMAGCPAFIEPDHTLEHIDKFTSVHYLFEMMERLKNREDRLGIWQKQVAGVLADKRIMDESLRAVGL